jgi:hypothetical protein
VRRVVRPVMNKLPQGTYGVYVNGEREMVVDVTEVSPTFTVGLEIGEEEVNLVVLRG